MLRKEAVVQEMIDLIKELQSNPLFEDFYLAGGTSLALQLGHRTSTDIDLFTYKGSKFFDINSFFYKNPDKYKIDQSIDGFIRVYINGIKVDLVYDDVGKLLDEPVREDGIVYINKNELAPMKLKAAVGRGVNRDFIDIAFLLQEMKLGEIFDLYKKKYGHVNINILKRELLTKIKAIKNDEWLAGIKMLRNEVKIKDIPNIIKAAVNEYNYSVGIGKK